MINFAIKLAATVAMEAVQVGLQASKRTSGPRLDELKVTVAEYGTPLPRFLGARKFACPVFFAEDLKEVKTTTKSKGGKMTSYSYYATFAVAIADNPIDKVLKIWFDEKLVYDITGTGPVSLLSALADFVNGTPSALDLSTIMRVYTGSETQLPDPTYQAWCEDKYGPNSAPAFRGLSYLFFDQLPVNDFGNRIPQIDVLAVSGSAAAYPYESKTGLNDLLNSALTPDKTTLITTDSTGGNHVQAWDLPSRTLISSAVTPVAVGGHDFGTEGPNSFYVYTGSELWLLDTVGGGSLITNAFSANYGGVQYVGGQVLFLPQTNGSTNYGVGLGPVADVSIGLNVTHFFADSDGAAWGIGPKRSGGDVGIFQVGGGVTWIHTGSDNDVAAMDNGKGQFFVLQSSGHGYLVDKLTLAIVHTSTATDTVGNAGYDLRRDFNVPVPGSRTVWTRFSQWDTQTGEFIRTVNSSDWKAAASSFTIFDPVNDAILSRESFTATSITWRFLDRASSTGTTLGAVVSTMCDAAGLTARDTSQLTQIIQGYSWTRGDVKSQMEPVLDIHDVDARPHDFLIEFKPRGAAPVGTILTPDFAKSGDAARYKVTLTQDTDLPKVVRVNFADTAYDQQTNNVLSPLPVDVVDSQRDDVVDLTTYAATTNEAQQLSDRYMRRQWNSRETIENSLTAQSLALEPGDVTTLNLDGIAQNARLVKQTIAAGKIDCTFVRDETGLATLNSATTGPAMDDRTVEVISIPGPVNGFLIDAPLKEDSDADTRPLLYTGAGTYATIAFPGAMIWEATGAGTSLAYDQLFDTVASGASWGTCGSTLATANANLWDRGNTLTVTLQSGSLTSVTEADINANPLLNLILVGKSGNWEYLNFTTATLNGDGTYTLSGFKRGRRGTESACAGHAGGEVFVLPSSLTIEPMGADEVGASLSFKAQAVGRSLAAAAPINVAPFTGATLKPYAPASVKWLYDGTNLSGTITRRTRVGGTWNGSTIPLGEASEAYEVDIYNGATFKRTISVSATNVFTYTAAMAAADGITLPTPPSIKAYQLSAVVGRGFALAA